VPDGVNNPLLLFLRGGNRNFGLGNPGSDFSCIRNYTVLATTYRDGVSEGIDEFGLSDVNDVDNLLLYVPKLEEKLNLVFKPSQIFVLGASRGGMQMFLALSRSLWLQSQVQKAASLCGLLDLRMLIASRKDMKKMFIEDYGFVPSVNEESWIRQRDPMEVVGKIRKDLPLLIVQGTQDIRLDLGIGLNMTRKLQENGNSVTYLEIEGGDHCLRNQPHCMELIADWFER
jgi:dipeptidyl aminopeptidase/acylaminoacyl peptidase